MFCLFGCNQATLRTYSYCVVDHVERQIVHDQSSWIAHCDGDGSVIFPQRVDSGDLVYFTPYYENDDAVTVYGYVHSIDKVVP